MGVRAKNGYSQVRKFVRGTKNVSLDVTCKN